MYFYFDLEMALVVPHPLKIFKCDRSAKSLADLSEAHRSAKLLADLSETSGPVDQVHYGYNGPGPLSIKLCNYERKEQRHPFPVI